MKTIKLFRNHTIFIFLLGLSVFIFLFCRFGLDILRGETDAGDFGIYYPALKAVLQGNNMYGYATGEGSVFKYPPYFGIIFSPLALLPFAKAAFIWSVINSAFFAIGIVAFYFIKFRGINPLNYTIFFLLGFLFIFRALMPELKLGNTDLLVLGFFCLFLLFYFQGKTALSALFFTLASFIKLGPLIVLLYFLKRRQFKFILWFVLFTLLLLILLPLLVTFSFKEVFLMLGDWHKDIFTALPQNIIHLQSLKYLLLRYLTNTDIYKINILSLPSQAISIIFKTLSIVLVIGALCYNGWTKRNIGNLEKEVSLIDINLLLILAMIFSPAATYLNYVYMIIPLLTLFLITWGQREHYLKFFWIALIVMMGANNFTRNATWKILGIKNVKEYLPNLVFMVWPILALMLYLLLYCLRSRLLFLNKNK